MNLQDLQKLKNKVPSSILGRQAIANYINRVFNVNGEVFIDLLDIKINSLTQKQLVGILRAKKPSYILTKVSPVIKEFLINKRYLPKDKRLTLEMTIYNNINKIKNQYFEEKEIKIYENLGSRWWGENDSIQPESFDLEQEDFEEISHNIRNFIHGNI